MIRNDDRQMTKDSHMTVVRKEGEVRGAPGTEKMIHNAYNQDSLGWS